MLRFLLLFVSPQAQIKLRSLLCENKHTNPPNKFSWSRTPSVTHLALYPFVAKPLGRATDTLSNVPESDVTRTHSLETTVTFHRPCPICSSLNMPASTCLHGQCCCLKCSLPPKAHTLTPDPLLTLSAGKNPSYSSSSNAVSSAPPSPTPPGRLILFL